MFFGVTEDWGLGSFFLFHETPRAPQLNPQSSLTPKNTQVTTGYESEFIVQFMSAQGAAKVREFEKKRQRKSSKPSQEEQLTISILSNLNTLPSERDA